MSEPNKQQEQKPEALNKEEEQTTKPTEHQNLNRNLSRGDILFEDVFRRADKNDDYKLSFEEFRLYFEDAHLSETDLGEIFSSIDVNHDHNIELEELCSYFKREFSPYRDLFVSLEISHEAVSSALAHTNQVYQTLDKFEQFKTRFYLKEFIGQLEYLYRPIYVALQKLSEQTPIAPKKTKSATQTNKNQARNEARWNFENESFAHSKLKAQVDRLSKFISKLENQSSLKLEMPEEGLTSSNDDEGYTVLSREWNIQKSHVDKFLADLRVYLKKTKSEEACFYTYVKRNFSENEQPQYFLYEVWSSADGLREHYSSSHYRQHAKELIDVLVSPEKLQEIILPIEWWPQENLSLIHI
eukprot:TRINITY_DN10790_c0_g1_i2.p1 TRINITY_DN10790_c0_g1~~TRINITY_DN10790_c0_g1_i2.p1  ORF type:complete len:356 (-),score=79.40 TRINITY_DN10790_c0_g1_i2:21-1088(-)